MRAYIGARQRAAKNSVLCVRVLCSNAQGISVMLFTSGFPSPFSPASASACFYWRPPPFPPLFFLLTCFLQVKKAVEKAVDSNAINRLMALEVCFYCALNRY